MYKTISQLTDNALDFRVVEGPEIQKYYLENNYLPGNGGLNKSCMRNKRKNHFMKMYSDNPNQVKMLILLNKQGKLLGRALVWKLDIPSGKEFMDRIYTVKDSDVNL